MKPKLRLLLGCFLGLLLIAPDARAQSYPSKPIRLIVPVPAGASTDAIARIVMPAAGKILGQQIVIENEGGAASIPGTARAAKMAPDGYTLLFGNSSTHAVNPHSSTRCRTIPRRTSFRWRYCGRRR